MIPLPTDWSVTLLAQAVALTHPDGEDVAMIFYRDRVRPVRPVKVLVAEVIRHWPQLSVNLMGDLEQFMTYDGEYAAVVTLVGQHNNRPVQHDLGFVLTDDFYSSVGSVCWSPSHRDEVAFLVRELVRNDVHALGVRRRRFYYEPPRGWQPLAHFLQVEWLPPDYPKNATTIFVYPANPIEIVGDVDLTDAFTHLERAGYQVEPVANVESFSTAHALTGTSQDVMGSRQGAPSLWRRTVLLRDTRYVYPIELTSCAQSSLTAHFKDLESLVDSVQPLPPPQRFEEAREVMKHWLD